MVQEAEATCFKAICKVEAQKVSQAASFHKEHGKYMQDLEEQAIGEESRSHNNFLSTCQAILYNIPPQLKGALATSYHILLGQTPPSPPLALPQKASPMEEQPITAASPTPVPKQSPRPKKMTPFARSCGEHAYGQNHSKGYPGRTSQPQEARDPSLVQNTQAQPCQGI